MEINDAIKEITKRTAKYEEPDWENNLTYDSMATTLEPIYFWILDFMETLGLKTEKLSDNFTASPGSAYFGDIGARVTVMQDRAMSILKLLSSREGMIANIMALIDELRIREMQLKDYEDAESKDKETGKLGLLALKRRWVDDVDKLKGPASILEMSRAAFPNIRNYFDSVDTAAEIDKREEWNDIVKKILKDRLRQFEKWREMDKARTSKLYKVGKGMLRGQVNNVNLYVKWLKPYLKVAEQLGMSKGRKAALVNVFDTMILELSLFGKEEVNIHKEVIAKNLPKRYDKLKLRKYYPCTFIDFSFRSSPTKKTYQGAAAYSYAGKVDVRFRGYALNDEEILLLKKKFYEEDFDYALGIAQGFTETGLVSLSELKEDIDHFLLEKERKAEEKEERRGEEIESNPFVALGTAFLEIFGLRKAGMKKAEKEEKQAENENFTKDEIEKLKKLESGGIKRDTFEERVVRDLAKEKAKETCFKIYDVYKKAHKMLSFPNPFD